MTVNVAWPAASVITPDVGAIVDEPFSAANVTVTPGTGLALWSSMVTVMVDAAEPLAATAPGFAWTEDWLTCEMPAMNVTEVVWLTVTLSVVSVAT